MGRYPLIWKLFWIPEMKKEKAFYPQEKLFYSELRVMVYNFFATVYAGKA